MDGTRALLGTALGGVVLGVAVLLYGEANSVQTAVFGGGAVVVLSVGLLVGVVAGLDEPEGAESAH